MTSFRQISVGVLAPAAVLACMSVGVGPSLGASSRAPASEGAVKIDTGQAEAVLQVLRQRQAGSVPDASWGALWQTRGFAQFEQRQQSFGAKDVRGKMRAFLMSDAPLADLATLEAAITRWRGLDAAAAAARALAYLPAGTELGATIYPVIKSARNSFVYDLDGDPAIFMHVNGKRSAADIEDTLAHELHHVGSVQGCGDPPDRDRLTPGARDALDWMSGFGEGLAMLAAAGGPDVHPHAGSKAAAWVVWERDVARFNEDVRRLEAFFLDLLEGRLDEDAQRQAGFEFINTDEVPQGAFYTVGWKMAALVERQLGRGRVIAAVCDPRLLLEAYDEVAATQPRGDGGGLQRWSPELLERLR